MTRLRTSTSTSPFVATIRDESQEKPYPRRTGKTQIGTKQEDTGTKKRIAAFLTKNECTNDVI